LGPFVPAPPEVAMQMLRDQGGPSYDASGRKMRGGPHMSGAAPIIAVPPNFRPDPRRMRRLMFCINPCLDIVVCYLLLSYFPRVFLSVRNPF